VTAAFPEVFCACGESILFGSDASEEERALPTCSKCEQLTAESLSLLASRFADDGLAPSDPLVTEHP